MIFSVLWFLHQEISLLNWGKVTRDIAGWSKIVIISCFSTTFIKYHYLVSFWRGKVESWQMQGPFLHKASRSCFEIHWPTSLPTVPAFPLLHCTSPNACRHLLHESKHPGFKNEVPGYTQPSCAPQMYANLYSIPLYWYQIWNMQYAAYQVLVKQLQAFTQQSLSYQQVFQIQVLGKTPMSLFLDSSVDHKQIFSWDTSYNPSKFIRHM